MGVMARFREFFAQDDFAGDAYGWLTNQISHIGLGMVAALAFSAAWYHVAGEFPLKIVAVASVAGIYVASEVMRGWSWRDGLEDTLFMAGYGCGGAMLLFCEVTPGAPLLIVSVDDALPVVAIAAAHLVAGTRMRT